MSDGQLIAWVTANPLEAIICLLVLIALLR